MQPRPENDEEDDAVLLSRIVSGDRGAFSTLVRRHATRFYRLAYRFVYNREDAEDIVQEAFVKLWERPQLWQAERNAAFTTWFYRIVVNRCLDHRKKKRPSLLSDDMEIKDESESNEERLMRGERQHWMESQIAVLPARQRAALNLCFYEGLSNQEAADVMGMRVKALQSLLMRAKTTLKEKLETMEY